MAFTTTCLVKFFIAALVVSSAVATQLGVLEAVEPLARVGVRELETSVLVEEDANDDEDLEEQTLLEAGLGAELNDLTHLEKLTMQELYSVDASSQKYGAEEFDCADEVVLRLAIAESFYGKSYDDCVNETMAKTFAPGGSGEKLMEPKGSGSGSGLTREEVESKVRARCITKQGHSIALGPRLTRMIFHDAADYNNSMLYDGTAVALEKTGVDSCLRTALLSTGLNQKDDDDDLDEIMKGDPNHNRGLNNAVKWVLKMAAASKLSQPDIEVLGAVTALEAWMAGPEMGIQYGRVKGECQKIVCTNEKCWDHTTPFFKQPVAEPVGSGMFCPMTNTLEPLRKVVGLSLDELVALQGAHSVGGVIVCSGLGNVASGPYCPTNCGIPPGRFFDNGNLDGTSFDDTPGKLDNRYYQLLMDEEYEDLPSCDTAKTYFPVLSKRGLSKAGNSSVGGSGGSGKGKDLASTCSAGVKYEPENICEVEACAENCSKSSVCLEAENSESVDAESYKEAWSDCLNCKRMCTESSRRKFAKNHAKDEFASCKAKCNTTTECVQSAGYDHKVCTADCNSAYKTCKGNSPPKFDMKSCRSKCANGKAGISCREACHESRKTNSADIKTALAKCKATRTSSLADCKAKNALLKTCKKCPSNCKKTAHSEANKVYNESSITLKPTRWCKRLTPTKQCLDASIKMPINGGWGDCPEDMRVTIPNTGSGRLTIVQNLERWTKFRGLYKRVMVLPSDWSYLGAADTKSLFKRYGTNEADWKANFKQAFNKIAELGWSGKLKKCVPVSCTLESSTLSCPVPTNGIGNFENKKATAQFQLQRTSIGLEEFVRPTSLDFNIAKCDPPIQQGATSCQIIGGYGVKAKVTCSSYNGYCTTDAASATETIIADEWKTSGGQEPTCNHDTPNSAMLETDASPLSSTEISKVVRRHRKLRGAKFPEDGSVFLQGDVVFADDEEIEDGFDEEEEDSEYHLHREDGNIEL